MKLVLQYFYKKRQVIGWSILCGLIYLLIFSLGGFCRKSQSYINIKLSVTVKLSRYYYAERMFVCQVLLPQIVEKVNTVNTEFAKKILKSAFQYGKLYKDYCMPKHLRGQQRLILGE